MILTAMHIFIVSIILRKNTVDARALAYTLLACGMPTYTKGFQAATRTQQLSYPRYIKFLHAH